MSYNNNNSFVFINFIQKYKINDQALFLSNTIKIKTLKLTKIVHDKFILVLLLSNNIYNKEIKLFVIKMYDKIF